MGNEDCIDVARRLGRALDRNDFDAARLHLSLTCRYVIRDEEIVGDQAIIASYRTSNDWAEQSLDLIEYDSSVRPGPDVVLA